VGEDGFVIDFYQLKKIIGATLQELDHSCLNDTLQNTTAESIALWIAERLKKEMETTSIKLYSLKLWEGKNKWVLID
ncbi:6-carboxytetrahydropterin synthase, partial [Klebsiella pneumoniae]|nr:6-carboxytetrahydropterin synthase [Klebsiella pneumoniae]